MVIFSKHTNNSYTGVAFTNAVVNNTTVNGAAILEPWSKGNSLQFIFNGSIAASSVLSVKIQGLLRSDGTTWEDVTGYALPTGSWDNGEAIDGGIVRAELDLNLFDGDTYKSLRLVITNGAAQIAWISAMYTITGLRHQPSGDTDIFHSVQRALTAV